MTCPNTTHNTTHTTRVHPIQIIHQAIRFPSPRPAIVTQTSALHGINESRRNEAGCITLVSLPLSTNSSMHHHGLFRLYCWAPLAVTRAVADSSGDVMLRPAWMLLCPEWTPGPLRHTSHAPAISRVRSQIHIRLFGLSTSIHTSRHIRICMHIHTAMITWMSSSPL